MRTALRSIEEVAHIWASQSQSEGRAASMFFRDNRIYSYGEHFEIARIVDDKKGAEVAGTVLDNYTVTRLDADSLVVGCHVIPRTEIQRIALQLGV